ncbi:hypothetical protein GRI75_13360 [Altererythrobacter soli]|uniref:Uncharacterized protein n=1 Tax=Croceibacterium soli TaxID=1739690 RepID=A0A6I4UZF6_9SPHN|nr:hypothetical protein [Croceibacterium soli]MXP42627.1 hypothetical protein [Croceibacterium soli]
MPDRQSRHPDNDMIDAAQEESVPTAQQSAAGGQVSRQVGSRAELHRAEGTLEGDEVERATGRDNPDQDAQKGNKTFDKIRSGQQNG